MEKLSKADLEKEAILNPEKAEKLFAINEQEAMERYAYLKKLVDVYKAEE